MAACKLAVVVRCSGSGHRRVTPSVAAVGGAGIADALHTGGIVLTEQQFTLAVAHVDRAAVNVQFEGCVLRLDVVAVEPQYAEGLGLKAAHTDGNLPFLQILGVIAEVKTCQRHRLLCRVVQLYPTIEIIGGADEFIDIGGHNLVDDQGVARCGSLLPGAPRGCNDES